MRDVAFLEQEILRLGPWHHEVELAPDLSTRHWLEKGDADAPFFDPAKTLRDGLMRFFPSGLQGRSLLDCACNCGGFLFAARDAGAGRCFGFDVRQHWIDQAEFLRASRAAPGDGIAFEVLDLYELPAKGLEPFDITLFNGILYHLPDPVGGLRIAADLTREVMVVNTQTAVGYPDGLMRVGREDTEGGLSGVYGLKFAPTGPSTIDTILRWAGFVETRVAWIREDDGGGNGSGRLEMVASKVPGLLDGDPQSAPSPS